MTSSNQILFFLCSFFKTLIHLILYTIYIPYTPIYIHDSQNYIYESKIIFQYLFYLSDKLNLNYLCDSSYNLTTCRYIT